MLLKIHSKTESKKKIIF